MKNWAFTRNMCTPSGGFVLAETAEEALKLINFAYGYTETTVYCAATGEKVTA